MSEALIIFVRNPELGKVKTRLAATLGQEKALEIYQQLLAHTLAITKTLAIQKFVFYEGVITKQDMWEVNGYHQLLQKETDLGKKMHYAFEAVLEKGFNKVVIIGSDCIELTESIIQEAFYQLNTKEVVIGPANDGGYYLLGMRCLHPELFINKKWSSNTVYGATVNDFNELGLSHYELPVLIDIDTEDDWRQTRKKNNQPNSA
ncbi:MAG TPA: TIGR04282 family arsenosugar biosynthesis glycosyltransferase [Chitinophagaceae bacterium]|nr:TIGR04282 family arsenosugar biosynthesis glycosyltransferase [Chitinophagaceae bacterium]